MFRKLTVQYRYKLQQTARDEIKQLTFKIHLSSHPTPHAIGYVRISDFIADVLHFPGEIILEIMAKYIFRNIFPLIQ